MKARRGPDGRHPTLALTPREAETLRLYEEGKSAPEIAAALGCSANRVRTCLQVARHKSVVLHAVKASEGRRAS